MGAADSVEFLRKCVFIGSTSDRHFIKDDTGGRRWWPLFKSAAKDAAVRANVN